MGRPESFITEIIMTKESLFINAEICRLFSIMFYNPEETFLADNEPLRLLSELLGDQESVNSEDAQKLISAAYNVDKETLVLDYAGLFIGPYKLQAPPYGSVYLDTAKMVNDKSTADVNNIYREFGVDVSDEMDEPADHVAIELEFLHTALITIANKKSDGEDTQELEQTFMRFVEVYFKPFVMQLAGRMINNASTDFYKTLGRLVKDYSESFRPEF